jgi:hypothetical protein
MDYSINLHETVKVSDFVKAETEIDAIIYRQEFEKYRQAYLKDKSDHDLIFCFIFLQVYIECFLHQNMRRVTEMEFKPPRDHILTAWLNGERRKVPQKIDDFTANFFSPIPADVQHLTDLIKDRFGNISSIRNLFAHGHKVASWSDSDGNSGISPARSLLTESQLNQSIDEVNELGSAWSDLLDKILLQCKALRRVDDFKFLKI